MDQKQLLKTLLDITEMANDISMEIENISGNAETLSNFIHKLFIEINPIQEPRGDFYSWENYKQETIDYIEQGSK
jgi:hypothetical protein